MNNNDTNLNNKTNPNQNPMSDNGLETLQGTSLGSMGSNGQNPMNNEVNPEIQNTMESNFVNSFPNSPEVFSQSPIVPENQMAQQNTIPVEPTVFSGETLNLSNQAMNQNMNSNMAPSMENPFNLSNQAMNQNMNSNMAPSMENPLNLSNQAIGQNLNSNMASSMENPLNLSNQAMGQNMNNGMNPNMNNNMNPNMAPSMENPLNLNNQAMGQNMNNGIPTNNMNQNYPNQNFTSTPNMMENGNQEMNPFNSGVNNLFNSVPTPPTMNDINGGNMTPNNDKKGKKAKISKTTIILLVILLIVLIGTGVYFVLTNVNSKKSKVTITPKEVMLNLGSTLSEDVNDYATITGSNTCTVDTSKIDINNIGPYTFKIVCGALTKEGKAIVQDLKAPRVVVRELMVTPNTFVKIEDFIVSCVDTSECSYELEDKKVSLEEMIKTEGTYNFNIIVSDDYNNKEVVKLTLIISNSAPIRYLYCTKAPVKNDVLLAEEEISYNYGIDENDTLSVTEKIYYYIFEDEEDYLTLKEGFDAKKGINGIIGQTIFEDDEFTITITVKLTTSELEKEFNVTPFPTEYSLLSQFNIDQGITCKNK